MAFVWKRSSSLFYALVLLKVNKEDENRLLGIYLQFNGNRRTMHIIKGWSVHSKSVLLVDESGNNKEKILVYVLIKSSLICRAT